MDTVGAGMAPSSARLDVPGSFKAAEEVSCLQAGLWGLCHRDRVGAAARGALSTTLSGCSDGCPGAASWAVQGQLQHTELLSCTTAEQGDGFYSSAPLASVWFQGAQTGSLQACSPTHFQVSEMIMQGEFEGGRGETFPMGHGRAFHQRALGQL